MCGRFFLAVTPEELAHLFAIDSPPALSPRYNIAPTQEVLTVRADREGGRCWATTTWGLVPSWAEDQKIGSRLINARGETVAEKPSFRSAFRRRRCLIPASGFFEWHRAGSQRIPYLLHMKDGRPFALAGLWERWQSPEGTPLETCTILTTEANEVVAELHDRMPVILPPARFDEWLQRSPLGDDRLQQLLTPFPAAKMESFQVSQQVNRAGNDDPSLIEPATLFGAR